MIPLVGWLLSGRTLTERDDLEAERGLVGQPVWGPAELLADLELRLGLPSTEATHALRVQAHASRLAELAGSRFYARSVAVDPMGTAATLLRWRDALVTAGWNGEHVARGGERLDTLAALEQMAPLPTGEADRLRRVEQELATAPYDALLLAEPQEIWPGRWRRIFARLAAAGTPVGERPPLTEVAACDTDLGRLQALLRGEKRDAAPVAGDGTIVVLRADTSWDAAHALAALLARCDAHATAIIRGGEHATLDTALAAHGLATLGARSASPWRPALQVLPLAIELVFEPRDPERVLELLTLPIGPFQGKVGRILAGALAEAPGIGGAAWIEAKAKLEDPEAVARIEAWLECPAHPASGAPPQALIDAAERVREWLRKRLAAPQENNVLAAAYHGACAFLEALAADARPSLDVVAARHLVADVHPAPKLALAPEQTGRIDAVDRPGALRRSRDLLVWWHCVAGSEWRPPPQPWRPAEIEALCAAGIALPDLGLRLAAETSSWRQAVLAARSRLWLVVPRSSAGDAHEPHPIVDEIFARLGASEADVARLTVETASLRGGESALGLAAKTAKLAPLRLPEPRTEWTIGPVAPATRHSASSLEALVGCPLRWVLRYRAGLRPGALAAIPEGPLLYGKLGHRLVEELHHRGHLASPEGVERELPALFDRLVREEAAGLLAAGMSFELAHVRAQIEASIRSLSELLVASKLRVVAVETTVTTGWRGGELEGRLDLLLEDEHGKEVVIDLKWGHGHYRDLLAAGHATQLAVYAAARKLASGAQSLPRAAYFSLKQGKLLAPQLGPFTAIRPIDGPSVADTWTRLERTVDEVEALLAKRKVPVTGLRRSLPLVDIVRRGSADKVLALKTESACRYCDYPALCGKSWER